MDWQNLLFVAIGIVITGLVSWATGLLIAFFNSRIKNAELANFLGEALNIVSNSVKATYQTYVEKLKGEDAFTKEAQKIALAKALETAKSQMSEKIKEKIQANYGNLDDWLISTIESIIYDLKNKKAAS